MRNGRRLSPPRDVPPAAPRRDGGRVKRSRRFCYLAESPTLLTPSEASSLAVQSQPSAKNATDNQLSVTHLLTPSEASSLAVQSQLSAKNATDNHLLVTHLLNPEEAGSPAVESRPVGCKYLSVALNQLRPSIWPSLIPIRRA